MAACSSIPNPTWSFKDTVGYMDITLTTGYNGCYTDTTIKNAIKINGPIAKIKSASFDCASPLNYQFTSELLDATSWDWYFGDGSKILNSTNKTPTHVYTSSGNKKVSLIAHNSSNGCPDFIDTLIVKVRKIQANFTGPQPNSPFSVCLGIPNAYIARTSIDVAQECGTSYRWYMYDTSATEPVLYVGNIDSVRYAFTRPGKHLIKLEIKGENGCKSSKTLSVKVYQVTAKFIPTKDTTICSSPLLKFTNRSIDNDTVITKYKWLVKSLARPPDTLIYTSFSDSLSPTYPFTKISDSPFRVLLRVQDSLGCKDSTNIKITISQPDTGITTNPAPPNICAGGSVTFSGNKPATQSYKWYFSNGDSSSSVSPPTQTYPNKGIYPVVVKIKDRYWHRLLLIGQENYLL
jgi:PKD repeat protein